MAISKQRKSELMTEYAGQLEQSQGLILADYRGLSVKEISNLRSTVRPMGARFQVVKNRLMKRVLEEAGISVPDDWLIGPTAISFCHEDVPPVAKALTDAAKDLENILHIKGGVLEGAIIDVDGVKALANLPPREVLLAQVLGTINAPATQVTGVVASGIRQVLNVLQAYADKLGEAGGGAEPAPEPA